MRKIVCNACVIDEVQVCRLHFLAYLVIIIGSYCWSFLKLEVNELEGRLNLDNQFKILIEQSLARYRLS